MKNKKVKLAIFSLVTATALVLGSVTGCKKKCEHSYRWTEEVPATCSREGRERGVCQICSDVTTRVIPIDPSKHSYGDWDIIAPGETQNGSATRTCANNSAHTDNVTLPALTENYAGYKSADITTPPTAITEGTLHLVYDFNGEDIGVDVILPRRKLETVADAVTLASSLAGNIRSVKGYTKESADSAPNEFEVEFGDNYTRVRNEAEKEQCWYSLDANGVPFGVYQRYESISNAEGGDSGEEGGGSVMPDPDVDADITEILSDPRAKKNVTADDMKGFGYASGGNYMRSYGAEDTLKKYYEMATVASDRGKAVKYDEHKNMSEDGIFTFDFSFSYYENPFFCRYKIEAELYPTGEINKLTVTTKVIRGYMIAEDEEGGKLFYEDGDIIFAEEYEAGDNNEPLYEYDADGNLLYDGVKKDVKGNELLNAKGETIPRPMPKAGTYTSWYSDSHSEVSVRTLCYEKQTLKSPDDVVPVNPYTSDILYIDDFKVTYDNKILAGERVTMPSVTAVDFGFTDLAPGTASLDYDPIEVYVRTERAGDIKLDINGDNPYNIMGFFNEADDVVTINAKAAGEFTFVFKPKGGRCEKEVKVLIEKGAPSEIITQAYTYSDAGGTVKYTWTGVDSESEAVPLYVGQTLLIKGNAPADEQAYVDTRIDANVSALNRNYVTFEEAEVDGEKAWNVTASRAGEYRIYVSSVKNPNIFTNFLIEVRDIPSVLDLFEGDYEAKLEYIKVGDAISTSDLTAKLEHGNNWRRGTLTLNIGGDEVVYGYTVEDTDEKKNVITLTYRSGISPETETYDFSLEINEMYKLTLTHSTGFGDEKETVVLSRPKTEEVPSEDSQLQE